MSSPSVASGDPATRGRLTVAVASLVLLAVACGGAIPEPEVEVPQGRQFIPMVPDSVDDVGLAPSVTVDGEGLPTISYFGFPAKLVEGAIPVARLWSSLESLIRCASPPDSVGAGCPSLM